MERCQGSVDETDGSSSLSSSRSLQELLRAYSSDVGLCGLGFSSLEPTWFDVNHLQRRTLDGQRSTMNFTFRRPVRSCTPQATFPFARSIIVGYHRYAPSARGDGGGREAIVASYAMRDEYSVLRSKLEKLAELVRARGYRATIVIDDNALVDTAIARRSGQGWIGRNTLFLMNRSGPFVLVGSIVTDAELEVDLPINRRSCGTCYRCVDACPTGALDGRGGLDAERCLAWLLQKPGSFPHEFRSAVGRRIYGCDACLLSCPVGLPLQRGLDDQSEEGRSEVERRSDESVLPYSLIELLSLGDRELLERCRHFYVPKRDPNHLRRNLLLALGNSEVPLLEAQGILERYLDSDNAVLSEQARWSLEQLRLRSL